MRNIAARIQTVDDAREFARQRLPKSIFQYYDCGSGSDVTTRANLAAFEQVLFRPHTATWYASRELRTTVVGHEISMPVVISSCGQLAIGHRDGECGVARAAGRAKTLMILSGASSTAIEKVIAEASGPVFYQLYYFGGRDASEPIIERVQRAGAKALVLTVDSAAPSRGPRHLPYRERVRAPQGIGLWEALRFAPQALTRPAWLIDYLRDGWRAPEVAMCLDEQGHALTRFDGGIKKMYEQTPQWQDIAWIRERWKGPLIIKGILRADDARRAVDEGADAIVVSNHGGNYMDGSMPALRALPDVVAAVGHKTEVLFDSGVRRGIDVIRAMALGARAVLLGRAYVWPHLAAGEAGVDHILALFRQQIDDGLAYLGVKSIHELDRSYLDITWPRQHP